MMAQMRVAPGVHKEGEAVTVDKEGWEHGW
jgi:hypothetical protein